MKISFALATLALAAAVTAYSPYEHKKPAHYVHHAPKHYVHHGYKPKPKKHYPHHGYKPKTSHKYHGLKAASIPSDANVAFTSCSGGSATVTLKGLQLNPGTPSKSSPLTVTTYGDVTKDIANGAKLNVDAYIGSTKVLGSVYDLCNAATVCPISVGADRAFSSTIPVPAELPPFVDIKIHAQAVNADGSELFCMETTVNFSP